MCFKNKNEDPFCGGKYHYNLQETLFTSKIMPRKGDKVWSVTHGPFYDAIY